MRVRSSSGTRSVCDAVSIGNTERHPHGGRNGKCHACAGRCEAGCIKQLLAGKHTTTAFLPGMTVTLPDDGWWSSHDSPGEFNVRLIAHPGAAVFFWIDPIPVKDHLVVAGVPNTPVGILTWMRGNDYLVISAPFGVSAPTGVSILGGGITALSVRAHVTDLAPPEGPACLGGPCVDYFRFRDRQAYITYGTGLGEPVRLYLATIGSGSSTHMLLVSVDEQTESDPAVFSLLQAGADKILLTLHLPSKVPKT